MHAQMAKNDSTSIAQTRNDLGIAFGRPFIARPEPAPRHLSRDIDIVFDGNRDAIERTAAVTSLCLLPSLFPEDMPKTR